MADQRRGHLVQARIDSELAAWVEKEMPYGFRQQFIEACFENLRLLFEKGALPPLSEYARHATVGAIVQLVHPVKEDDSVR